MKLTQGAIGNLINRYRAVLKKCHLINTFGSLAVASMLVMGGADVAAAAGSVALGGENNYNSTTTSEVNHLVGGWLYYKDAIQPENSTPVDIDITLDITGGSISEIIGGSYIRGENSKVDGAALGNITTNIKGGSAAEFVVGGSKIANDKDAHLTTGKTSLTITDGIFGNAGDTGDYELVIGGNYIKTGTSGTDNSATTEGSTVTISGGTFHASVVGGSVAHKYDGTPTALSVMDNGDTTVTISGGTFTPSESTGGGSITLEAAVIGGGLAYGGGNTVLGSSEHPVTSSVSIEGGTINGKVVAGSVVAEGGSSATVYGNTTLSMSDGTVNDDFVGGGMVQDTTTATNAPESGYRLDVTGNASVAITGGMANGEIIAGNYVRGNGSARVANSSVKISGGTFAEDSTANKAQYVAGGSKSMAYEGDTATTLVEGNSSVLINGAVAVADGAVVGGSVAKATESGVATATVSGNSSVTVDNAGAKLTGLVGGGLAEVYNIGSGSATSNVEGISSVTVKSGTIDQIKFGAEAGNTGTLSASVVGGGLANGSKSTSSVGGTNVLIEGGSIGYWEDDSHTNAVEGKVVAGGAAVNGGVTTVNGDTHLTMTGGEVFADLIGGNLVDGTASKNNIWADDTASTVTGSTYVTFSGGTVHGEIVGGGYVRNANTASNVQGDTHVTITTDSGAAEPQGWVQYVIGGGKANAIAAQTASANVVGSTYVEMNGGKHEFGTVIGGGLARAQGGTAQANVANTYLTVNDGTLAGVAGGGVAEMRSGRSATADIFQTSNLTINGGTINAVEYDKLAAASPFAVVGGGIAWSSANAGTAQATVATANTTIKGGTIKGDVLAGGLADGTGTTAKVTTANLNMTGGTVNGSVYAGGAALDSGSSTVNNFAVVIKGGTITDDVVAGNYSPSEATQIALFNVETQADESGTQGSIVIGGGSIGGDVKVGDGVTADVIIDGNNANVEGQYTGNALSTLSFEHYDARFDKVATGFGTVKAGVDSVVRVTHLSTGKQPAEDATGIYAGTNNELTVAGEGTITAENITVAANDNLKVEGDLTVAEKGTVEVTNTGVLNVNDGGTFDMSQASAITTTDRDDIQVETGGTLNMGASQVNGNFNGATLASGATVNLAGSLTGEDALTVDKLQKKFGTTGLINAGDNAVTGMYGEENVDNGKIAFNDISITNIATNASKNLVVTGVETANKLHGGWKGVELAKGNNDGLSVATGTLQLTGEAGNSGFAVVDGNVNFNEKDATLLLGEAGTNKSGTIDGTVTFAQDPISNMRLEVLGNENAAFIVNGDINGQNGAKGNVKASGGVSLTANGNITAGTLIADGSTITAAGGQGEGASLGNIKTAKLTAQNGGTVSAKNDLEVLGGGSVTLTNNGTIEAGHNVTLNVNVDNADGTIIAGNKIGADNHDITKADKGQLTLTAHLISAKTISATNITAAKLWTTGDVTVDAGLLTLTQGEEEASQVSSLTLSNGTQGVIDGSLQLKNAGTGVFAVGTGTDSVGGTTLSATHIDLNGGMLLVDPAWGLDSSNVAVENLSATPELAGEVMIVNGSIGLGQNSYLAIGTKDLKWLPGVAGALSEGGTKAALGIYKPVQIGSGEALVVDGTLMGTTAGKDTLYGTVTSATQNSATFAANTLLVINGADQSIGNAAISFANRTPGTLSVAEGAKLQITDAVAGQMYTIVSNTSLANGNTTLSGWQDVQSTTDMITISGAHYNETANTVTVDAKRENAQVIFPDLSEEMAGLVNELYTGREIDGTWGDYADVNSEHQGIKFLSRATDNRFLGKDKAAAASTIESAARMAFAAAVPQMTKMASDAATNSVVNRLGFANPDNGAKAMNMEGKLVDDKALGLALWIAPLWSNQTGFGMEAGNLDYGYNANLGGVSLGADYTWANNIRAGLMFNIGGGYAESAGGDLSETTNSMTFWGVGAYGGWAYNNFAVMADVSYTSTWNSVDQDLDHRMGMGDLEADIQASAISAGLRFEYKLETQYLDFIPHVGARYMSINTWGYDVDSNAGTVLEGDGFQQNIWTFPVGITFSKELEMNNDWYFKPAVDFTVIPAAGDIKAKEDVRFTGMPYSTEIETQMMDYFTWQGGVGLEFGNENMSVGVNYTLQAGQNSTGHGVFGMFRYEF